MIEIGIDTMGIDADAPDQEALDRGVLAAVSCHVVGGQQLPFIQQGTDQAMKVPSIIVKFALSRDAAIEWAALLKEKAEQLPEEKKSSILTAQSMREAGMLAETDQRLRGN